jgi:hypothetical protein
MGQRYFPTFNELTTDVTVDKNAVQSGAIYANTNSDSTVRVTLPTLSSPAYDGYTIIALQTHNSNEIQLYSADERIDYFDGNSSNSGSDQSLLATGTVGTRLQATWFKRRWVVEVITGSLD